MTFTLTAKKSDVLSGAIILLHRYLPSGTVIPTTSAATLDPYETSWEDRWHRVNTPLLPFNNISEVEDGDNVIITVSTSDSSYTTKATFLPPLFDRFAINWVSPTER